MSRPADQRGKPSKRRPASRRARVARSAGARHPDRHRAQHRRLADGDAQQRRVQRRVERGDRAKAPAARPVDVAVRPPGAPLPDEEPAPALARAGTRAPRGARSRSAPGPGRRPPPRAAVRRRGRRAATASNGTASRAAGSGGHGGPAADLPEQPPDRDARDHAPPRVERVRDRLGGVRAHAPGVDPGVERLVRSGDRRGRPGRRRGPPAPGPSAPGPRPGPGCRVGRTASRGTTAPRARWHRRSRGPRPLPRLPPRTGRGPSPGCGRGAAGGAPGRRPSAAGPAAAGSRRSPLATSRRRRRGRPSRPAR